MSQICDAFKMTGRRKSGIGKLPGDDFGSIKKPQSINEVGQSNRFSFRVSKKPDDLTKLDDRCGFEPIHPNSNLLNPQGRQSGDISPYDPVQIENYKSQAMRYESALGLTIDRVYQNAQGRTVWGFCSKASPAGFWEVTQAGGTYVHIPNPILLIVCPRPFKLSELGGAAESDGVAVWSQLQGRLTAISPSTGDGALDPIIVIFGVPGVYDPPIQLLVALEDDPTIFDILQITTTPTSTDYGVGFCALNSDINPCNTVQSFAIAPRSAGGGYVYDGSALNVTWNLPTCNQDTLKAMVWLQNLTGQYEAIASYLPDSQRLIVVQPNTYYVVRSDYEILGLRKYSAQSQYFFVPYNPGETNPLLMKQVIFADSIQKGIAFAPGNGAYVAYQLTVISVQPSDSYESDLAIALGNAQYNRYDLKSVSIQPTDSYGSSLAIALGGSDYLKYQLSGVIIG